MDKLVSWGDREVLIKEVTQTILTYAMSAFKFTKKLCCIIQSSILQFWWGYSHEGRKFHWLSGEKLCSIKDDGGMGFRDMKAFNYALLAKQVWHLVRDDSSLVSCLLKAKYYPHCNILDAKWGIKPSFMWRSL